MIGTLRDTNKNHPFLAIAIIWVMAFVVAVPADAQRKKKRTAPPNTRTGQLNTVVIDCWKQYGATYDPVKKKWILYIPEMNAQSVAGAIRRCISSRTGIPQSQIPIPEQTID